MLAGRVRGDTVLSEKQNVKRKTTSGDGGGGDGGEKCKPGLTFRSRTRVEIKRHGSFLSDKIREKIFPKGVGIGCFKLS